MAMVASTKNLNFGMSAKKPYQLAKPPLYRLRAGNVSVPANSSCGTKRKAEYSERMEIKRNREDPYSRRSKSTQIRVGNVAVPAKSVCGTKGMEVKRNKEEDGKRIVWKGAQKRLSDESRRPYISSPNALRLELLKMRPFAPTFSKPQKNTVGCVGGNNKFDQVKLNTLEYRKLQQREREREAARKAREEMEGSEAFENNIEILHELAFIIGDYSFPGPLKGYGSMYQNRKYAKPLERFGLYLKQDDPDHMFTDV